MNVGIIGSRAFNDYHLLQDVISDHLEISEINSIISGGAKGADALAEQFAAENHIRCSIHKPDWKTYNKAAGIMRNKEIVADSDILFAFWDGISKGTEHSINLAKKSEKTVVVTIFPQAGENLKPEA